MRTRFIPFVAMPLVLLAVIALSAGPGLSADGAELYAKCSGCHGSQGEKAAMGVGRPLKGMAAQDVEKALEGYKEGTFGGERKAVMERIAKTLSPEDTKALAEYIAKF